jgi:hypothetical protein
MNHPDDIPNTDQWHLYKKVPLSLPYFDRFSHALELESW